MNDFRYLRSRDPSKNIVTVPFSKKLGRIDSNPRSHSVDVSNVREESGGLQEPSAGHAPCIYVVSVWDLSVTHDVVSVTQVLVSVTLDEAAVGNCRPCSPTCVDHSHPCVWGLLNTVLIAADLCVLSVVILELIKTTTCNSYRRRTISSKLPLKRSKRDLNITQS